MNVIGLRRLVDSIETIYGDKVIHMPVCKSEDSQVKDELYMVLDKDSGSIDLIK
ncbi:MAG: hypothetical protein AABY22_18185 [Nanoarchaeota archaeon]